MELRFVDTPFIDREVIELRSVCEKDVPDPKVREGERDVDTSSLVLPSRESPGKDEMLVVLSP